MYVCVWYIALKQNTLLQATRVQRAHLDIFLWFVFLHGHGVFFIFILLINPLLVAGRGPVRNECVVLLPPFALNSCRNHNIYRYISMECVHAVCLRSVFWETYRFFIHHTPHENSVPRAVWTAMMTMPFVDAASIPGRPISL